MNQHYSQSIRYRQDSPGSSDEYWPMLDRKMQCAFFALTDETMDHAVKIEMRLMIVKIADKMMKMPIQKVTVKSSSAASDFRTSVVISAELKSTPSSVDNNNDMNTMDEE